MRMRIIEASHPRGMRWLPGKNRRTTATAIPIRTRMLNRSSRKRNGSRRDELRNGSEKPALNPLPMKFNVPNEMITKPQNMRKWAVPITI